MINILKMILGVLVSVHVWAADEPKHEDQDLNVKTEDVKLDEATTGTSENAEVKKFHNLRFGPEVRYYRYVEPGLISHQGIMYGAWGEWSYDTQYFKGILNGNIFMGSIDYDGALCDTNTSVCTDYKAKTSDLISRFTHRFNYALKPTFELFFGGGYRYLYDKGEGTGFYRRLGNYYFLPIGATFKQKLDDDDNGAKLIYDIEYDVFLMGTMTSKLSDVNSKYSDLIHKQSSGYGIQLSFGYEQSHVNRSHPMFFQCFYETWNIKESDVVELKINGSGSGNYFVEPKNFSESHGVKVGWLF